MKFKHLLVAGLLATTAASPAVHASDFLASLEEKKPAGVTISREELSRFEEMEQVALPTLSNEKKQVEEELELTKRQLELHTQEVSNLRDKLQADLKAFTEEEDRLKKEILSLTSDKEAAEQELARYNDQLKTHALVKREEIAQHNEELRVAQENLAKLSAEYEDLKKKTNGKTAVDLTDKTVIENAELDQLKRSLTEAEHKVSTLEQEKIDLEQEIEDGAEKFKQLETKAVALEDDVTNLQVKLQTANETLAELTANHKKALQNLNAAIDDRDAEIEELKEKVNKVQAEAQAFYGTLNPILGSMDRMFRQAMVDNLGVDSVNNPVAIASSRSLMHALMSNAQLVDKEDDDRVLGMSALDAMFSSVFNVLVNKQDLTLFKNVARSGEMTAPTQEVQFVADNTLKDLDIGQLDPKLKGGKPQPPKASSPKNTLKKKKKSSAQSSSNKMEAESEKKKRLAALEQKRLAALEQKRLAEEEALAQQKKELETNKKKTDDSLDSNLLDFDDHHSLDGSTGSFDLDSAVAELTNTYGTSNFNFGLLEKVIESVSVDFDGLNSALAAKAPNRRSDKKSYFQSLDSAIAEAKKGDVSSLFAICSDKDVNPVNFIIR